MAGGTTPTLEQAAGLAMGAVDALGGARAGQGRRVALIGHTSDSYLTAWLALVLAGSETALVNPDYPAGLLAEMLEQLDPDAVVWVGRTAEPSVAPHAAHLDATGLDRGILACADDGRDLAGGSGAGRPPAAELPALAEAPGLARDRFDTAGWMHTSGTTGVPKFCEQTHEYFLRLGRFIADSMCLSEADTVLAPLPMFHINPLGYGVVGGLTGGVDMLGLESFSASGFWPLVRDTRATVLILHAPQVEILKRATTADDAAGHRVSRVFFADPDFLEMFGVPLGFSAYGSTEAGGLCHIWAWRRVSGPTWPRACPATAAGPATRCNGGWTAPSRPRPRPERQTAPVGQTAPEPARSGCGPTGPGCCSRATGGPTGWCDRSTRTAGSPPGTWGRVDGAGNLVFIERRSESIRVKGEFVPIGYVEQRFASVDGIEDVAVWRRDSDLVDDEIVLYMTGTGPIPDRQDPGGAGRSARLHAPGSGRTSGGDPPRLGRGQGAAAASRPCHRARGRGPGGCNPMTARDATESGKDRP